MLENIVFAIEGVAIKVGILSPIFLVVVILYYLLYWRYKRFKDLLAKFSSLIESLFEWFGICLAKFFVYILPLSLVIIFLLAKSIRFFVYKI